MEKETIDWDKVCSNFHQALQYKTKPTNELNRKITNKTHEAVEIDPLYCDPRRPEAKIFACRCGIHYFSKSALKLHIITMKFGNAYTCKYCLGGFCHFHSLKKHVKNIHEKPFKDFLCGFCHTSFNTCGNFTKHLIAIHE